VRSLRNRLALVFFGITLLSIAALYLYVAPGLQSRLLSEQLRALSRSLQQHSAQVVRAVAPGSSVSNGQVGRDVGDAAGTSGYRVTLLQVSYLAGVPTWSVTADSGNPSAQELSFPAVRDAIRSGKTSSRTETTKGGTVAEAALPIGDPPFKVLVFSARVGDVVRNVAIVRHEILVAGGIALLLSLIGGYVVARALSQRVKRLERAAEQVAAGDFGHTIPVDSADELGQLAVAFNDMQRQLAQLESARKQFIATASHELRTPIFSLGGFVELLEGDDLDPETRQRFLEQLRDQVERLRKLSVDLLDLSRLDSGSLELRPEQVDIGELARSVSGEFEPTLAQRDAHLELRLSVRAIEALCDPVRIAQIMRILLDNALTHTPPGTRIVVTAGRDNGRVRLSVRDDGDGIKPAAMSRIFEPFYTADETQGSGLGLAIASELADRMAGHLSVQSDPGATTFTLELPA
jgi:signal transduction histidine kinase